MLYPPELHEARMSWSKHSVLAVMVDDFFDVGGSMEELLNLIQLLNKYLFLSSTEFHITVSFLHIKRVKEIGEQWC